MSLMMLPFPSCKAMCDGLDLKRLDLCSITGRAYIAMMGVVGTTGSARNRVTADSARDRQLQTQRQPGVTPRQCLRLGVFHRPNRQVLARRSEHFPLSQHNHHSSAVEILQLWCHLCITISPKSVQAHSLTTHLAVPVCELGGSSAVMTHVVWQLLLAPWMVCWLLDACVKRARCILNREEVSEGDLYNAPMGRLLLVLPQISSAMEHRAACGP